MKEQPNTPTRHKIAKTPKTANTLLNEVGWRGADPRQYQAQRDYLTKHAGIKGLQWVAANEVEKARDLFYRDGFVVVVEALADLGAEDVGAFDDFVHAFAGRYANVCAVCFIKCVDEVDQCTDCVVVV